MKNNLAQQVVFSVEKKEVATIVVNNVPQGTQIVEYAIMKCPQCGHVLATFNKGVSLVDIYKELAKHSPVEEMQQYCDKCGCKLICDKSVVDEIDIANI